MKIGLHIHILSSFKTVYWIFKYGFAGAEEKAKKDLIDLMEKNYPMQTVCIQEKGPRLKR